MLNKESVRAVVAEVLEIEDFADDDRFAEDYGVDSMMVLELVSKLEKRFKMSINEEYYSKMVSFNEVYSIVEELVGA